MNERIEILRQTPIFSKQPKEVLTDVAQRIKEEKFKAQDQICATGETGTTMYMVKSGEVKISTPDAEGKEIVLAYLGRGKYFGEMSLLTGAGRSACALATLDTVLYVLKKKDFDDLVKKYPAIALEMSRVLAERLREVNFPQPIKRKPPKLIYLVSPLLPSLQKNLAYLLAQAIAQESEKKVALVDFDFDAPDILLQLKQAELSRRIKERLRTLATQSAQEFAKELPLYNGLSFLTIEEAALKHKISSGDYLSTLMGLLKEKFDFIILSIGNPAKKTSSLDALLHNKFCEFSDLILYYLPSLEGAKAANQFLGKNKALQRKTDITVQRLSDAKEKNTPKIYSLLKKEPGFRLSLDKKSLDLLEDGKAIPPDMKRLARRLSGVSIGVAIGGGGGIRSCAGIGVLEVLDKEGIPVDLIAGSSLGGAIAILYALGKSAKENMEICRKASQSELTINLIPLSNFMKPKNFFGTIDELAGKKIYLEELKIPTYIVTADILTCRQVILSQGLIHTAANASVSIPVLSPPVKYKNMLLVDGSITNMIPGDIIKEKGAGISVAINVNNLDVSQPGAAKRMFRSDNKTGRLLRSIPFLRDFIDPNIPNIAARTVLIPNIYLTKNKQSLFDVYLTPPVTHYQPFEPRSIEAIVAAGRKEARLFIPEIKKKIRELKEG